MWELFVFERTNLNELIVSWFTHIRSGVMKDKLCKKKTSFVKRLAYLFA